MRLSLRFILPLVLALSALAYVSVLVLDQLTTRWFIRDLDGRAQLIADSMQEPMSEMVGQRPAGKVIALFARAIRDERLYAIAFCDANRKVAFKTATFPAELNCVAPAPQADFAGSILRLEAGALYVSYFPVVLGAAPAGQLVIAQDMSFIERRSADSRNYVLALFLVLGIVVSLITVLVAHLSWRGWIAGVRSFLRGEGLVRPFDSSAAAAGTGMAAQPAAEIRPLVGDMRALLREVTEDRNAAEDVTAQWNPDALRRLLRERFYGDQILVVSNREPYIHTRSDTGIKVRRPAGGLVTAVEPVMRAVSGTWIAHGSGSADRETVDEHAHVQVPPDHPAYTLRRIWLTPEEEQGYYYGFANEGMWPLCHIAHVRPVFRRADWEQYVAVNQRFADAVVAEARTPDPVVLVQDYHFALLPRMVRDALPRATIIAFWHIPWPNQESFGICPWREELLDGMLGSTILGFHTAQHCKNFLETVDRYLEARIEHESATVSLGGKLTRVESYPISVDWPEERPDTALSAEQAAAKLRSDLGFNASHLIGLGVDRLDYTKGIVERLEAIETMLEKHPELGDRFTFIQIAAPTRSALGEYQSFEERVRATAARINARFAAAGNDPIRLLVETLDYSAIFEHYRACNVCVVTSLHDGMNLVAKEFVSARDDEQGALVLSQFAGASRELHEALIVNPYDIEQTAEAIYRALTMPAAEQRERMRALRSSVKDFNIYRWAGRMLLDAAGLRQRERVSDRIVSHRRRFMRSQAPG
ncbi:MAG: trehalose-6-phosphate synthase [Proteobacteria bacterium]|nr:trehalose-6-phosphate synthase [Pseudomonadota bacterium]